MLVKTRNLILAVAVIHLTAAAFTLAAGAAVGQEGGTVSPLPTNKYDLTTGIVTLIIFGLTLVILAKTAWGPVVKGLAAREGKIRSDIKSAEQANVDAMATLAKYQSDLRDSELRVKDMLAKAQIDAEALTTRTKLLAQQEVEEVKTRATKEIDSSKSAALAEIREQAATLSTQIASKILRREINENDQRDLVRSSLDQLSTRN